MNGIKAVAVEFVLIDIAILRHPLNAKIKKNQPHEIKTEKPDFKRGFMKYCIEQEQENTCFLVRVHGKVK